MVQRTPYSSHLRNEGETSGRTNHTKSYRRLIMSGMRQWQDRQFDFKNAFFISPPLLAALTWERLELVILEASDQMISHLTLFKLFALHAVLLPHTYL